MLLRNSFFLDPFHVADIRQKKGGGDIYALNKVK
jgi:hypothetical protein